MCISLPDACEVEWYTHKHYSVKLLGAKEPHKRILLPAFQPSPQGQCDSIVLITAEVMTLRTFVVDRYNSLVYQVLGLYLVICSVVLYCRNVSRCQVQFSIKRFRNSSVCFQCSQCVVCVCYLTLRYESISKDKDCCLNDQVTSERYIRILVMISSIVGFYCVQCFFQGLQGGNFPP